MSMPTEITDKDALRESRKDTANTLIRNLQDYHNLSTSDVRIGMHGRKDGHIVPMRSVNYLRYLAYAENHQTDGHFLTQSDIEREGLTVKPGSEPLILERWSIDARKHYHCHEFPLYDVRSLEGPEDVLDAYRLSQFPEYDKPSQDAVARLFENAGVLPKGAPHDRQEIYQAVSAYASKVAPDDAIKQKHLSHLIRQTTGVNPVHLDDELYTENDIQYFKDNPDALFSSFSEASRDMRHITEELRFLDRQIAWEREAYLQQLDEEEKARPLASLRVVYHYSECAYEFTDRNGKVLPEDEDIELVGEDAYRFLVQVNHADKKYYHDIGYNKTDFSVTFAGSTYEGRFDLGDLSLANKKTIAEAMEIATSAEHKFYLNNEDMLQYHYQLIQYNNRNKVQNDPEYATLDAYRKHLEKEIEQLHASWQEFAKKEQIFLAAHPEYEAINQEDAHPYIAVCPASQLEHLKEKGAVLDVLPKDSLKSFVLFKPDATNARRTYDLEDVIDGSAPVHEALPDGLVAFTTACKPEMERNWDYWENPRFVFTREEIEHLQSFQDLTLQVDSYVPCRSTVAEAERETCSGLGSVQGFFNAVKADDEHYLKAMSKQVYIPGNAPKVNLKLYAKGEPIFALAYQEGRGDLAKAARDYLPLNLPEQYREAYDTYQRYSTAQRRNALGERYVNRPAGHEVHFPTVEDSRKNFLAAMRSKLPDGKPKKASRITSEWRQEAAVYYQNYPLLDPAVDTPRKAVLGTIREMARDGYTDARIKSLLKTIHPSRTEDALAVLQSKEGKNAIREARKEHERAGGR